jgi:sugar phosphate isomerase/epimerase
MLSFRSDPSSKKPQLPEYSPVSRVRVLSRNQGEIVDRRRLLVGGAALATSIMLPNSRIHANPIASPRASDFQSPRFGLVTYLWGKDMVLPALLEACEYAGMAGVELRTEHKHGVEPGLSDLQRKEVRKQFERSGITLVGYGSNCEFHSPKPDVLAANIQLCKDYIHLMHDCGGSGVKVKPNAFAPDVPRAKTIEQIGNALNELAEYGEKYGQQIRLEVHGQGTSELSVVRDIYQVARHPNATVCWNSNNEDLAAPGLEANFNMVRSRFGETLHLRELNLNDYPYQDLINLLVKTEYTGWVLMEARTDPKNKLEAMKEQRAIFDSMVQLAIKANPISNATPSK